MLQLLSAMVRDQAKVIFALDGERGLETARRIRPDLILLDVEMGGIDGFEVCRQIVKDPELCDTAIIFVTAHNDVATEIGGLEAGCVDFISKPLNAAIVQARVRTHLRLQNVQAQLRQLANKDGLTALYNRRYFDANFESELARHRRHKLSLGLALIDVDYFKRYNDHYGHQMGDLCLQQIAAALPIGTKRPGELVARYGGEEFVVLIPNCDDAALQGYGHWISAQIAELAVPHVASDVKPVVTISCGLYTCIPDKEITSAQMLKCADEALYAAKAQGRNRSVNFKDALPS